MAASEQSAFTPTEIWTPAHGAELSEPVSRALAVMNRKDPAQLIETLQTQVEHDDGVAYAVLTGDNPAEYSTTDALVLFNPYANAVSPNTLVKAEFIREVAKQADVRDAEGKLKPVIMLASPGIAGSDLRLSQAEFEEVRGGELGPVARELLRAVSERNIGRATLLGFSQGADVALAGARSAYSANLDAEAVAVGDPAGAEARNRLQLARDLSKASPKDFRRAAEDTGLTAQKVALGAGVADFFRFGASALMPFNLAISKALGSQTFEARMQEILDAGTVEQIVVGYGENSAVAKPEHVESAIQRLYDRNGRDSFTSIKVNDANHAWGDDLTLLAKLFMRAA